MNEESRTGPSFFQLNFFVIGKEPTAQSKMHRCLQEIRERQSGIRNVELEIEELQDVNALYVLDLKRMNKLEVEEKEIRIRQTERKIKSNNMHIETLKSKVSAWTEEINFIKKLYDQIVERVPLKSWNDYEVQLEYWNEKMVQEIKTSLLLNTPVNTEVIKTALSLPDQAPIKKQLLEHIQKKQVVDK